MPKESPDPAAVFAIANSLWQACHTLAATDRTLDLADAYSGIDGLMREVMRIATKFEQWSCMHVSFAQLEEPWPYILQDRFGRECLSVLVPDGLAEFDEHDCRRIAGRLRLPLNAHPSQRQLTFS